MKKYRYAELSQQAQQVVRLDLFEHCKQAEIDYNWQPHIYTESDLEILIYKNNDDYEFNGEVFDDLS
jgi:hypothetical protein